MPTVCGSGRGAGPAGVPRSAARGERSGNLSSCATRRQGSVTHLAFCFIPMVYSLRLCWTTRREKQVRIAALLLILLNTSAYAGVYSCIAPDGRTELQSTPCKRGLLAHVKVQPPPVAPVDPKPTPQLLQQPPTPSEQAPADPSKQCRTDKRGWMVCGQANTEQSRPK